MMVTPPSAIDGVLDSTSAATTVLVVVPLTGPAESLLAALAPAVPLVFVAEVPLVPEVLDEALPTPAAPEVPPAVAALLPLLPEVPLWVVTLLPLAPEVPLWVAALLPLAPLARPPLAAELPICEELVVVTERGEPLLVTEPPVTFSVVA